MQTVQEIQPGPTQDLPPTQNEAPPPSAPGKKTTRQWAAWTHEEEANFFIALRQVGKNFDKITSRVQSKNKEQVRHYYYRIIKRMNKLLGPGFVLDAKNTKDANAALLRWWSLLEKCSCSASKLHLKPRRFKTFVTALGHALLKDRKKTKRKQPIQDNISPSTTSGIPAGTNKAVVSDPESANMLPIEVQSLQKLGSGKGTTVKRNVGQCTNRCKGETSKTKPCQRRRKESDGPVSSAAYKRWEKAANAGVTLVAEAAEHLERAALAEQTSPDLVVLNSPSIQPEGMCLPKRRNGQSQATALKASVQSSSKINVCKEPRKVVVESRARDAAIPSTATITSNQATLQGATLLPLSQPGQNYDSCKILGECYNSGLSGRADNTVKLTLQLFPIDEFTRKTLEKDGHNPHLELTLKARKMISSVLQHLMQKWGRSTVASGELMLLPYNAQWKDLPNCQSWTLKDTAASAGDVYVSLGSPAIFRLRYGWFSSRALQMSNAEPCHQPAPSVSPKDTIEESLLLENSRTLKVRKLDVGRSEGMSVLTNQGSMSGSFYSRYCLNLNKGRETELSCSHLSTQASSAYLDFAPSITLPLGSGQSNKSMSTVTTVKAPAVPSRQPATFSHEIRESGDVEVGYSNKFIPKTVEVVEDKDNEQGNKNSPQPFCSTCTEQTLHNAVPRKVCRVPEFSSPITCSSWLNEDSNGEFVQRLSENEDKYNNRIGLSTMDWVDSLSNISIGDLLNEASLTEHGNAYEGICVSSGIQPQLFPQYMDSFDTAINAHIARSQEVTNMPINHSQPSIWDGEETCDAFAFQKIPFSVQESEVVKNVVLPSSSPEVHTNLGGLSGSLERFALGNSTPDEVPCMEDLKAGSCAREQSQDSIGARQSAANDLYWTDSLGSLDISIRPSGVQGADILVGDNSISFSGLVAISLDAFQNCSIFGSEKKVSATTCGQDQQAHSLFPTNESGNNSLFLIGSKSMENRKPVSLDIKAEFTPAVVDLHGAEKQLTVSVDGVPV